MEKQFDINNMEIEPNREVITLLSKLFDSCKNDSAKTIEYLMKEEENIPGVYENIGLNEVLGVCVPSSIQSIDTNIDMDIVKSYCDSVNVFRNSETDSIKILSNLSKEEFIQSLLDIHKDKDIQNFVDLQSFINQNNCTDNDILVNDVVPNSLNKFNSNSFGKRGRNYFDQWEEDDFLYITKQKHKVKPMEQWSDTFKSYEESIDGYYREWSINNTPKAILNKNRKRDSAFNILAPPVPSAIHHPACWGLRSRKIDNVIHNKNIYELIHPACNSSTVVLPPAKQLNIPQNYCENDDIKKISDYLTKELELLETSLYVKFLKFNNMLKPRQFITDLKNKRMKLSNTLNHLYLCNEPKTSERNTYRFKPPRKKSDIKKNESCSRYETRKKQVFIDSPVKGSFDCREAPMIGACLQQNVNHANLILKLKIGDCIETLLDTKWVVSQVTHLRYDNNELLRFIKVRPVLENILSSFWIAVEDSVIAPLNTNVTIRKNKSLELLIHQLNNNKDDNITEMKSSINNRINPIIHSYYECNKKIEELKVPCIKDDIYSKELSCDVNPVKLLEDTVIDNDLTTYIVGSNGKIKVKVYDKLMTNDNSISIYSSEVSNETACTSNESLESVDQTSYYCNGFNQKNIELNDNNSIESLEMMKSLASISTIPIIKSVNSNRYNHNSIISSSLFKKEDTNNSIDLASKLFENFNCINSTSSLPKVLALLRNNK